MNVDAHFMAKRFRGLKETEGPEDNPQIMAMLRLNGEATFLGWPEHDEVPWCAAFVRYCYWLLGFPLERLGDLRARSWLRVGRRIDLPEAYPGWDIVVLKRDGGPGPEVINAPGHVGFFDYQDGEWVWVLGGNQSNSVSRQKFPVSRILGVRRLA